MNKQIFNVGVLIILGSLSLLLTSDNFRIVTAVYMVKEAMDSDNYGDISSIIKNITHNIFKK